MSYLFGNNEPPKPFNSPESNFMPNIGDQFSIAWIDRRDSSYTRGVYKCTAISQTMLVGEWVAGDKSYCEKPIVLPIASVRFYPIPPGFVEAMNGADKPAEETT